MRPDPLNASDPSLVLAVARFDESALAELYRRHAGAVFALAKRVLWDQALAEEVVQEVFLRFWSQPERFDSERGSLRSYLLALTHGQAVDQLRSEGSRREREKRDARATAESGYDLEREVWDLALAEHVREALSSLPHAERRAIELAYFGGCTYREVATLLEEPEGTVKSRIRAGLRRLHTLLNATGIASTRGAD
jgi:RNA polymerase sigma-70 factor (ECF subfamily)